MTEPLSTQAKPYAAEPQRQRVRKVGLNGNYWYAVELEKNLKPKEVTEVVFWKTSIALFRTANGEFAAVENRCAHRQLRLTEVGHVDENCLTCGYHGWSYDQTGKCVDICHDLGKLSEVPHIQLRKYPVKVKYGLVWIFPGNPDLAESTALPDIPPLDEEDPWPYVPIDLMFEGHHSMIMENVCDFNHEFLHRKYAPFTDSVLDGFSRDGETIEMSYTCKLGQGPIVKHFSEGQGTIKLWYKYPYQISDSNGKYLHWLFLLPIDEKRTRCFFLFLFGPLHFPLIKKPLPKFLRKALIHATNSIYTVPLLNQDQEVVAEEQKAFANHAGKPGYEFNPIINAFQKLTLEKWEEYTNSEIERMETIRSPQEKLAQAGAGVAS